MTFLGLIRHNVAAHKLRASLTAFAVAIGVMAVLALGVLTSSLKTSASEVLEIGKADFSVQQKNVDLLNGNIAQTDIASMAKLPGVGSIVGALIETDRYNSSYPAVIEVGLDPAQQAPFGVVLLAGRSYRPHSPNEIMLGYVLAKSIHKKVGDTLKMGGKTRVVVGLYRTNVSFGDSTMMFPLGTLQAENQLTGQVTLAFVKLAKGYTKAAVAASIDRHFIQYKSIKSLTDFGRNDRTLSLISAANTGGTILAAVIAITGVLNTTLLSFFERTREFGVLRSIGWSRWRVISLVVGEVVMVALFGLALGVLLGWVAVNVLQHLSELRGYFVPSYDIAIFGRALYFAFAVAILGALYPAVRAALLSPLDALRHE